jgi:GAF domain-containing protein
MAGMRTDTMPPMAVRPESIGQLELAGVEVVCLTYLGPHPQSYVRYVARRVKRRQPGVRVVACLLHGAASSQPIDAAELRVDAVVTSFGEIDSVLRDLIQPGSSKDGGRERPQDKEISRTAKKMKALATSEGWLEEYCTEVARTFDVPLAVATVADTSVHSGEGAGQGNPLTERVVSSRHALVLEDVSADKAFADTPFLLENGIQFYAGEPLVTKDDMIIGALSIMDTEPRKFSEKDRERLGSFAMALMSEFERRQQSEAGSDS